MLSVIIPTYNAVSHLPLLLKKLREQTLAHELVIIDSESTDGTHELVKGENIRLIIIPKESFNHGATRNLGWKLATFDTVLFMTQDALPASTDTLEKLVNMLHSRDNIAMAYGRQLPYPDTGVFGRFARTINYPNQSVIKDRALIPSMGIKTCSCSNSFAVYKKVDLESVSGFPANTILGEDVSVAARFILQGKGVAYCAESEVFHSHDYTVIEEFKRYFDIGVFHREQRDVLDEFSKAESEGFKYVLEEWHYLRQNKLLRLIPSQIVRTIAKYVGYKIGKFEDWLPLAVKSRISMHPRFWANSIKEV